MKLLGDFVFAVPNEWEKVTSIAPASVCDAGSRVNTIVAAKALYNEFNMARFSTGNLLLYR